MRKLLTNIPIPPKKPRLDLSDWQEFYTMPIGSSFELTDITDVHRCQKMRNVFRHKEWENPEHNFKRFEISVKHKMCWRVK